MTKDAYPVPHLSTASDSPLRAFEIQIVQRHAQIESWFRHQWGVVRSPFYASVDLRNAGFKVAPVDTNLFPAGFNNLNPAFESLCIQAIQREIEYYARSIDRVLIVPEDHSRNLFYLENLFILRSLFEKAGFDTRIGSIDPELKEARSLSVDRGQILIEPLRRTDKLLHIDDFEPDLVVLNNDLSTGIPAILMGVEQTITPLPELGWGKRLKSRHFAHYQRIVQEFASHIELDPWLLDPMFRNCGEVNFIRREGIDCLSRNITILLNDIRKKYDQYGIDHDPFVIVKADAGTYGMGVIAIRDVHQIETLNRRQRTKMARTKSGLVSKVIIQEGVYTHETWGTEGFTAEPVAYLIGHSVVGGFYRVHAERGCSENLNVPGMHFEHLAFDDCCLSPERDAVGHIHQNRFYVYGVVARLALLAAAREMLQYTGG